MFAGNQARALVASGEALAALGVAAVRDFREQLTESPELPATAHAFVIHSLKNAAEVELLRWIYGDRFVLIGAHAPRSLRVSNLARKVTAKAARFMEADFRAQAEELVRIDEEESEHALGQRVRDTFPLADVFVDASTPTALQRQVARFVEMLFGNRRHTPTRDELGMFHAQAAALASGALSRQVGAVITLSDGTLVATGCNEVPKSGGGHYWEGDDPDGRDFTWGEDTSQTYRSRIIEELLDTLDDAAEPTMAERTSQALQILEERLAHTRVMGLLEFGRIVHAEMSAIASAARRGVPVQGGTQYTTTFPCHVCARHVVACGITRLVYTDPYPKSLVLELHRDSIAVDPEASTSGMVRFEPFIGVGARLFGKLFRIGPEDRSDPFGKARPWAARQAEYSLASSRDDQPSLLARELHAMAVAEKLRQKARGHDLRSGWRTS